MVYKFSITAQSEGGASMCLHCPEVRASYTHLALWLNHLLSGPEKLLGCIRLVLLA
jgi:hypothetical protein